MCQNALLVVHLTQLKSTELSKFGLFCDWNVDVIKTIYALLISVYGMDVIIELEKEKEGFDWE